MPKKKVTQPKREMTQRQLSRWQMENRRQKIILLAGVILIVAILAVVGTGLFMNQYQPYHVTVVKVGETEYSMDYYINMLAYIGLQYGSPDYIPYFAESVPDNIAQNQIYVEEAAKLGITVSEADVQKYLKDKQLSSDQTRVDAVRALLTIEKLQSDYFPAQLPESTEHRNVQAMFLASQGQLDAVKARLDNGDSFVDLASELSLEKTSKDNRGDFGWLPNPQDVKKNLKNDFGWTPLGVLSNILNQGNGNTTIGDTPLENYVFASNTAVEGLGTAEDKNQMKEMGYWLVKVTETRAVNITPTPTATVTPGSNPTPTTVIEAHVYSILLASEQQALDIKAKLEQGGEGNDWDTLAKANSLHETTASSGGDRGFASKGTLGEAIDKIVFPDDPGQAPEVNKISDPIADGAQSTPGGFWLVRVGGINDQTIVDNHKTFLAQNMLRDWLKKVWENNQSRVQTFLTEEQKQFAIEQAQKR